MANVYKLPEVKALSMLLEDLTGKKVGIQTAQAWNIDPKQNVNAAIYVTDQGKVGTVCVCEMAVGGAVAAALTRVPVSLVNESVKAGKLSDNLSENLYEILNVCASLLNSPAYPHMKIKQLVSSPLPADVLAILQKPASRLDLEVDVAGYGKGKVSFVTTVA